MRERRRDNHLLIGRIVGQRQVYLCQAIRPCPAAHSKNPPVSFYQKNHGKILLPIHKPACPFRVRLHLRDKQRPHNPGLVLFPGIQIHQRGGNRTHIGHVPDGHLQHHIPLLNLIEIPLFQPQRETSHTVPVIDKTASASHIPPDAVCPCRPAAALSF